jgi:hypothetical protein
VLQKQGKNKQALLSLNEAQKICNNLKCEQPRDYDYILATNCYTAYQLIKIQKLDEAIDFLNISEKIVRKIIGFKLEGNTIVPPLGGVIKQKQTKLTIPQIQNYLLAISIMKTTALKFMMTTH